MAFKRKSKWKAMQQEIDILNSTATFKPKDFELLSIKRSREGMLNPLNSFKDEKVSSSVESLKRAREQYKAYNKKVTKLKDLGFIDDNFELLKPENVVQMTKSEKASYTRQLKQIDGITRVNSYQKMYEKELKLVNYINELNEYPTLYRDTLRDFALANLSRFNDLVYNYNRDEYTENKDRITINELQFIKDTARVNDKNIYRSEKARSLKFIQVINERGVTDPTGLSEFAKFRRMNDAYRSRLVRNKDYYVEIHEMLQKILAMPTEQKNALFDKWLANADYYVGFVYDYDSYGTGYSAGFTLLKQRLQELIDEILGQRTKPNHDSETDYADGILYE